MAYIATFNEEEYPVKVEETEGGQYRVWIGDESYDVDFYKAQENIYSLIVENQSYEVDVDIVGEDQYSVLLKDDHFDIVVQEEKKKKLAEKLGAGASGRQDIKSPMAGNVWKVLKAEGDEVAAGDVLIILEAMKMENEIKSPIDGKVTSMTAVEGTAVSSGDPLCVVEPPEEDDA